MVRAIVNEIFAIVNERREVNEVWTKVKISRNGPERCSGIRIIAGMAFRLEFLVGWYYDADARMVVPELY